jgi:hypothetical protein
VAIVRNYRLLLVLLVFWPFCVAIGAQPASAQTSLKTIDNPQGGTIVYGRVDGATTEAAAMAGVLRVVHDNCGERPRVGKVYKLRRTNSDAVFFTVVNHPAGNVQVAGMVITAPSGHNYIEAALVSDKAARFGSTVNPMLSRLFSEWHPDGAASPRARLGAGPIPPMHQVTLSDGTASLRIPDGWNVDPRSGGGTALVHGPRGEHIILDNAYNAEDPRGSAYRRQVQLGVPMPHTVVYPSNVDLARAFPDILQRLRASNGMAPAPLQVDRVEPLPASAGQRCVSAVGKVNPDGRGMVEMNRVLCATAADQYGLYAIYDSAFFIPLGSTDQQRATASAIMSSYNVDTQLVRARTDAMMAPVLSAMRQRWEAQEQALIAGNQRISGNIRQIGANATARMNATEAANDAQHAAWNQGEENISRNGQAFSNYLLDQTVIQDNNRYGNGTTAHGTVWNSTADALVKADPNRYEILNSPNFWKGVDF